MVSMSPVASFVTDRMLSSTVNHVSCVCLQGVRPLVDAALQASKSPRLVRSHVKCVFAYLCVERMYLLSFCLCDVFMSRLTFGIRFVPYLYAHSYASAFVEYRSIFLQLTHLPLQYVSCTILSLHVFYPTHLNQQFLFPNHSNQSFSHRTRVTMLRFVHMVHH